MDSTAIILMTIALFFWLTAAMLRTITIRDRVELSPFELQRRSSMGDKVAARTLSKRRTQPKIVALLTILHLSAITVSVAIMVSTLGSLWGFVVSLLLVIGLVAAQNLSLIHRMGQKIWNRYEKIIYQKVESWHWIKWFAGSTTKETSYKLGSIDELKVIIDNSRQLFDSDTRSRLKASLALGGKTVQDVMTPLSLVDGISADESLGPLVLDGLHKTGHTRFPVYQKDMHHIVGMLYLHDIVELRSAKASVKDAMDPRVYFIRQDQTLTHALHGFLRSHHHLFIVVNDYRETVGVLSLEDVLENVIGHRIVDEFDRFEDLRAVAAANPHRNNELKGSTDI